MENYFCSSLVNDATILCQARFVFGNRLVPSTLLLITDKAECTYTTKPAACSLDFFMQVVTAKAENFRVSQMLMNCLIAAEQILVSTSYTIILGQVLSIM